jgi:SWI/SNF-related matrix-associated actin-dependent regulator of chromatin subfamily A3
MPAKKKRSKSKGRRRAASTTTFLGSVFTEIAGMQYYEADVESGEKVQLEREPENEHDKNAIRVENKHFKQAGHVPGESPRG